MGGIKLLALDLDGTALRSDNTLSAGVKRAIERAAESGITVVAASGRPYSAMPKEILAMDAVSFFIASNGAAVYDKSGNRIYSRLLKESDVLTLLELTGDYDLVWEAFTEGETCTDSRYYNDPESYGCSKAYVGYVRSSRGCSDNMRQYIYDNRKNLDSVEFVSTDSGLRNELRAMLERELSGVYVTSSSRNFVEFMDGEATKANALRFICGKLKIEPKNIAAAGNADNDVDMIKLAGLGAAVKNACRACIEAADAVVDSNDNDGVAELIESKLIEADIQAETTTNRLTHEEVFNSIRKIIKGKK